MTNETPELNLPTYPFVLFGTPVVIGFLVHIFLWSPDLLNDSLALLIGIPLFVIGGALGLWSVYTMLSLGEHPEPGRGTNTIVASGPFRFSRNPSYVALVLTAVGVGIGIEAAAMLLTVPIGFAVLALWVVPAEERYLSAVLADDYNAYRARVRRWL